MSYPQTLRLLWQRSLALVTLESLPRLAFLPSGPVSLLRVLRESIRLQLLVKLPLMLVDLRRGRL